jgi:hypothetical protein
VVDQSDLLASITELGQAFARLGWRNRLPALREFFSVVRAGGSSTGSWSAEHVAKMQAALGLGSRPLKVAAACPCCPPPLSGAWAGARTVLHLEDRWVLQCAVCSAEWLVLSR